MGKLCGDKSPIEWGWLNIASAPRDTTLILVIDNRGGVSLVRGEGDIFREEDTLEELDNLRGWMPIPDPKMEY
jgi:hypothetical protein